MVFGVGRPESLNTTLNTTIDSAMIETQIEPQIIHTKLAPQLSAQMNQESVQHIPLKQIPVQNKTDQASQGQVISGQVTSVTEKAAEILNGWEGYVLSIVCVFRKDLIGEVESIGSFIYLLDSKCCLLPNSIKIQFQFTTY